MTSRERLRRAYFHEEMDRPGVYSRTGFPNADPTYDRLRRYLGEFSDLKLWWSDWRLEPAPVAEVSVEPCSADYERHVTVLHTPGGPLRSSYLASRRGLPGMQETYLVNSREDAERYLSLPVPTACVRADSFAAAEREVGERGIVDVGLGSNPAGFAAELCGSETFAVLSATDPDVLHLLCARRAAIMAALVKALLSHGVGPFFSMLGEEYVVPPLHGPRDFDRFNARYDRELIDLIHEGGGRVHVHCHGRIARVMGALVHMGVDVLHPFEGPPMGDITAAEAKQAARGRVCLEGNVQIDRMYDRTPDEIRHETAELIRDAFDDHRGLIVSPTASPYVRGRGEECFEQYRAMVETVWGA